jgi:hypothetical protein
MKRIKEINDKIDILYQERYKLTDLVIREHFGEICDLLLKIGFVDDSKRCDVRKYYKDTNQIKFYNRISVNIETNVWGFNINISKLKSVKENKDVRFNPHIRFEIHFDDNEENIKEKIKEIRETIIYEYNELLREKKLKRILNEKN